MSIHPDPRTAAEHFARYLEINYGLQLDFARRQALICELEAFSQPPAPEPAAKPARKQRAKAALKQENMNAEG